MDTHPLLALALGAVLAGIVACMIGDILEYLYGDRSSHCYRKRQRETAEEIAKATE